MDPLQSRVYATAQRELQELFREIASQGQVGPEELQTALLPFTAGDVRNDVLELVDELRRRHKSSVDEQEFIRVMWKKMYVSHLTLRTKCRPSSASSGVRGSSTRTRPDDTENTTGATAAEDSNINIPLAHVIVSIKRRSQLRQFADYYASRGISGADHLTAEVPAASSSSDSTTRGSPRHLHATARQQLQRRRVCFDRHVAIPAASLRAHTSPSYRAVACVFDPPVRAMVTLSLLPRAARNAQAVNCSKLFAVLFSKNAGSYVLGSAHFAQHARSEYLASVHAARAFDAPEQSLSPSAQVHDASLPSPLAVRDDVLIQTKLEDLGLRHVVTAASSDGSFVACTERKIHHWTEQVSYPVALDDAPTDSDDLKSNAFPEQQQERPVALNLDKEGDCFGVLGAKKLLARTKNIADVSFVKQLAAGADFVFALTAAGDVFAWGDSALGHHEVSPWRVPWFRSSENKVARIACGRHHVLVTTTSGLAYAWGSNVFGQLGHGDSSSILDAPVAEPAVIHIPVAHSQQRASATNAMSTSAPGAPDSDHAVLDVACGDDHSVLLLGSGRIYAFGDNWQGQVGVDPDSGAPDGSVFTPTEVALPDEQLSPGTETAAAASAVAPSPFGTRAYLITAYGASTAAVTTHGDVYQWGLCVPSGPESVCGLVARWTPQRLPIHGTEDDDEHKASSKHQRLLWHSIAIANGLVVLTQHTEVLLT